MADIKYESKVHKMVSMKTNSMFTFLFRCQHFVRLESLQNNRKIYVKHKIKICKNKNACNIIIQYNTRY